VEKAFQIKEKTKEKILNQSWKKGLQGKFPKFGRNNYKVNRLQNKSQRNPWEVLALKGGQPIIKGQ